MVLRDWNKPSNCGKWQQHYLVTLLDKYNSNITMRKFIMSVIFVSALIGIIMVAIFPLSFHWRTNSAKDIKYRYVNEHGEEIRVLCLGNSLLETCFNSDVIDSCYNFASAARISYYDSILAKRFIPKLPNLKIVIYPLSFPTIGGVFLSDSRCRRAEIAEYARFMRMLPEKKYLGYKEIAKIFFQGIHFPKNRKKTITESGYWPILYIGNALDDHPIGESMKEIYIHLLTVAKTCMENDVRFILVTTPVNSTYARESLDSTEYSKLHAIVDRIQSHYPVEYYDYIRDPMFGNDSLFFDQVHLNNRGATLFANRIKHDLHL
jgi:hypothetical protein